MVGHLILVTGASGTVGSRVLAGLVSAGGPVRAGDVDPQRVAARFPRVPAVAFDLTDPATWAAVFAGVRVMFRDAWTRP